MAKVDVAGATLGVLTQGRNEILDAIGGAASYLGERNFSKAAEKAEEAENKAYAALKRGDISGAEAAIALFKEELSDLKKADSIAAKAGELVKANDAIDKVVALSEVMHGRAPTLGEVTAMVGRQVVGKSPLGSILNLVDSMGDKNFATEAVSKIYDIVIDKPAAQLDKLPGIKHINQFTKEVASGVKKVTPEGVRNLVTGLANTPDTVVKGVWTALKEIGGAVIGRPSQRQQNELFQAISDEAEYLADSGMTRDEIASYFMERADDPFTGSVQFNYPSGQAGAVEREFPGVTFGDAYRHIIDEEGPLANENKVSLLDQLQAYGRFAEPETRKLYRSGLEIRDALTGETVTPYELNDMMNRGLPYELRDDYEHDDLGTELTPVDTNELEKQKYEEDKRRLEEEFRPQPFEGPPELMPLPGSAGQPGIDPLKEATLQPGESVEDARARGYGGVGPLPQDLLEDYEKPYDPTDYDPMYGGAPPAPGGTPSYEEPAPAPPAPVPVQPVDPLLPTPSPYLREEPILEYDPVPPATTPMPAPAPTPTPVQPVDPLLPVQAPRTTTDSFIPRQAPAPYQQASPSFQPQQAPTIDPLAPTYAPPAQASMAPGPLAAPTDTRRARGVGEQQLERSIIDDILKDDKQVRMAPQLSPDLRRRIF